MNQIQETVVIRQRGQLTMPDKIRENHVWLSLGAVVTVIDTPDRVIIEPLVSKEQEPVKKQVDWDKLWKDIKRIRAFKGKGRGNLSEFIAKDRKEHF